MKNKKSDGIIDGRCSGTVGAALMVEQYEFQYIFKIGRYKTEDKTIKSKNI